MIQSLIYGTTNPAKLQMMRDNLASLPLEIHGLEEYKGILPEIDESGNDPLENARIKALAYYRAIGKPVFSCDTGLYLEGLPNELQPGVHVRNVGGKSLTDEEMTCYYAGLAERCGGKMLARYQNAICLVVSENQVYEYMGDDLRGDAFYIVSKPRAQREPGFPIDPISVHIETGKYYYDMPARRGESMKDGFTAFFTRTILRDKETVTV